MKTTRLVPTVAAAMGLLMVALAFAPSAQADSTTVTRSNVISFDALAVGANYSGPCPGPLAQCLIYLIGQYCQMSPTCTLVLDLGSYVLKVVLDTAGQVLDIAYWLIDRTEMLVWQLYDVVISFVDDLINYVWPYVDRVAHLVTYVVDLLLGLADYAVAEAEWLIGVVGGIIKPFLDYVNKEVAALVWLVNQVVDETCYILVGGCPFVYFQKNLSAKRNYGATDSSLPPALAAPSGSSSGSVLGSALGSLLPPELGSSLGPSAAFA
jgi:hypothetical protein